MLFQFTFPTILNNNKASSTKKDFFFLCLGFCILTFASQLSIPLQPVPLTFQTSAVILLGLLFGSYYAAGSVSLYLLAGACGLPVFANFSAGIIHLYGPTGGYLLGFIPAALLTGYFAKLGFNKSILGCLVASFLAALIYFSCGVLVLSQYVGWENVLMLGVLPFVHTEVIKLSLLSVLIPRTWQKNAN